jgi:hypothetical protein
MELCTACKTYQAIKGHHHCESCKGLFEHSIIPGIKKKIIYIKFRGIDDWHRAVFKDINSATYYGDCDANKTGKPEDVIEYYRNNINKLEYFGNSFNCEPNGGLNPNHQLEILTTNENINSK